MTRINNPIIWADVPDNDVIRVGNAFYMVSTSMHSMPGGPIMKSYDLQHWSIVSYIFERLNEKDANNLENGENIYGQGSWAASLRKVGDWFYCLFNCNDDKHAYMFRTRNIEESNWEKYPLPMSLHDPALLIDDDGRRYVLYGNNEIKIVELSEDMLSIKLDGINETLFKTETEGIGLKAEGCHAYKINGKYYAILIEWPTEGNKRRREVCYRWSSIEDALKGNVEHKVIFDDDMGYMNAGVAQGAIFTLPEESRYDSLSLSGAPNEAKMGYDVRCGEEVHHMNQGPDGRNWVSLLFQDHGAVGRIPYILPVSWEDGWPMPGIEGRVPESYDLPLDPPVDVQAQVSYGNVAGEIILPGNKVGGAGFGDARLNAVQKAADRDYGSGLCMDDDFVRIRGEENSIADAKHLWQWNHNPDDMAWSLTERCGYLRLTNAHINELGVLQAKNTLTQRTYGPRCSAQTHVYLTGLNPGDSCGLVAMQGQFGIVGVRVDEDGSRSIVMCVNDGRYGEKVVAMEPIDRDDVYLRIDFEFENNTDEAVFYRSLDGKRWKKVGRPLKMQYTLDHFMGYRVGLYSYATLTTRGYADFGYFRWGNTSDCK